MKNLFTNKPNDFNKKNLSKSKLRTILGGDITDPNNDEDRDKKRKETIDRL